MAIVQAVKDGQIVDDTSDVTAGGKKKKEVNTELGQEQFLQLLIAQMQYQDPLEPTSNTEWVAQMATFSMVESLNNMKDTMAEQSANDLVGKYVIINDGDNGYVRGKVDYITKRNGETVLAVGDDFYTLDKLDTVADEEYYKGSVLANELHEMIQLLPSEENLTYVDDGLLKSAREAYDALTESQKQFVSDEDLSKLRTLEEKMTALKATRFTGLVDGLPSVSEIESADAETFASYKEKFKEASEYLENMTQAQKSKVTEETMNAYKKIEEAVQAAEKKLGAEDSSDPDKDVASLLQKILDELKNKENS